MFAPNVAQKMLPVAQKIGMVFLLIALVLTLVVYGGEMLGAMALGMCTRNIAALFAAFFGITNPPAGLFVMVGLMVPLAAIAAMVATHLFALQVPAGIP